MSGQRDELAAVRHNLERMSEALSKQLPPHIPVARFIAAALTAVQKKPDLMASDIDRDSLYLACKEAAEDGLLPDGREGAIVPRYDTDLRRKVCAWQPMVAGLVKLAWQCGGLASLHADVAYAGEVFEVRGGTAPGISHIYDLDKRGNGSSFDGVRAIYAAAKLSSGETMQAVLTMAEVEKIRALSKSKKGPWNDWPVEMAKVRAVRRLTKLLPLSSDRDADNRMRRAAERGDAIDGVAEDVTGQPAIAAPEGGKLAALEQALDTGAVPDVAQRQPEPVLVSQGVSDGRDPGWIDQVERSPPPLRQTRRAKPDQLRDDADAWIADLRACTTGAALSAILRDQLYRQNMDWYAEHRTELHKRVSAVQDEMVEKLMPFPGDR